MNTSTPAKSAPGASWLIQDTHPADVFIPEDFSEEQQMILDMCQRFLDTEVLPNIDRIDALEPGLMPQIMDKAGELGLLGVSIPEEYGGLGKPFIESMIVAEGLGGGYSFSVAMAAHTGIGTLPILYFGTDAQKSKYIPALASGKWKGAYGLTEPNSGSDALSGKTSARLSPDGKHYLLNGQKCWITNGGFAHVFTVFARVEAESGPTGFTAFIVERGMEGFSQGPEEHKMGIKGSSTVQLYFQDCKVPVENVLGEIGRGHLIAFNILNIGRLKLAAATMGGSKRCISTAVQYANTREQFGQPIARFGAMQHKLAEMAIRTWSDESALYRTCKLIQDKESELIAGGKPLAEALLAAAEEYAVECAIMKVHGSEVLDFVVDEAVQIHGGNGYSAEYPVSRAYRDSRINRIFEGTNEINRLLTVDMVLKRAMKSRLNLMGPAMSVMQELMSIPDFGGEEEGLFATEEKTIRQCRKAILMVAAGAAQKLMMKLEHEQEVLMNIADMAIKTYVAESNLLRVQKLVSLRGAEGVTLETEIMRCYLNDAVDSIHKSGKEAINGFAEGDEQRMMLLGLKRFTKYGSFNSKEARRQIAGRLIAEGRYCF